MKNKWFDFFFWLFIGALLVCVVVLLAPWPEARSTEKRALKSVTLGQEVRRIPAAIREPSGIERKTAAADRVKPEVAVENLGAQYKQNVDTAFISGLKLGFVCSTLGGQTEDLNRIIGAYQSNRFDIAEKWFDERMEARRPRR